MKKINHREMTEDALNRVSARFKVLAEPLRLRILQNLEAGKLSVTELSKAVGSTQPNVSKHLKILLDDGLISKRSEGNTVYYKIADASVFELCDVVCGSLKEKYAEQSAMFA